MAKEQKQAPPWTIYVAVAVVHGIAVADIAPVCETVCPNDIFRFVFIVFADVVGAPKEAEEGRSLQLSSLNITSVVKVDDAIEISTASVPFVAEPLIGVQFAAAPTARSVFHIRIGLNYLDEDDPQKNQVGQL